MSADMPAAAARSVPSGTVTFAFTDIEGSTQRWERAPDAMADAVRRHDALMRAAIERHGGHVFKTIGDAFCAAFARPRDALDAMLAAQRELAACDFGAVSGLRVRAALHTGTADDCDDDYFGPTVNRLARLLSTAHGGQLVVSGATAALLVHDLPERTSLRDLGRHRLKDLTLPEHVFQAVVPDLPDTFAPLRSLDAKAHNLPHVATSLIGREDDVEHIARHLDIARIVTLLGPGGVGKTRLSLHVAAHVLDGSLDGAYFIDLAPLTDGAYVATTVAAALHLTIDDRDPIAALGRAQAAAGFRQLRTSHRRCRTLYCPRRERVRRGVDSCDQPSRAWHRGRSRLRARHPTPARRSSACHRIGRRAHARARSQTVAATARRCFRVVTGGNRAALPR